jgi:hypothetical protein
MRWITAFSAILLAAGTFAGPALARQGTGLYAPFPSPPAGDRAARFVGVLGVRASRTAMREGRIESSGWPATGSSAPRARAGIGDHGPGPLWLALPSVAAMGAGVVLARRRLRRPPGAPPRRRPHPTGHPTNGRSDLDHWASPDPPSVV